MAKVFFSYSHDDEHHRDQLAKHLASLRHSGLIEEWHDRRLLAGADVNGEIDQKLNEADVVLCLVSASFLASHYCYKIEMQRALERHRMGEARVVPIIVRDCDWMLTPLGGLLAAPTDGKPITSWANLDEAFTNVAKQIRAVVQDLSNRPAQGAAAGGGGGAQGPRTVPPRAMAVPVAPRSSNLQMRKQFTQLQQDTYRTESFEYMAQYFENSLDDLKIGNAGIETQFRRIDANCFTATIYQHGDRKCECAINLGGGGFSSNAITYSADASSRGNSFNEQVSVEHDDQAMFLKPMGMASYGNAPKQLSQDDAAAYYWGLLMKRLQ